MLHLGEGLSPAGYPRAQATTCRRVVSSDGLTCGRALRSRDERSSGDCRRCTAQLEAIEMGWIDDCPGCGEIHDVVELCPEATPCIR